MLFLRGKENEKRAAGENTCYTLVFESITMVTGPSFSSETFISAPKIPDSVFSPDLEIAVLKYSNKGTALSGFAALIKEGRFPFL